MKRAAFACALALSAGLVTSAHATWMADTQWIDTGKPVSASSLLKLFKEADDRLVALERTVAARYTQNASQMLAAGPGVKVVGYTKDYDTDDAMNPNTGDYACPVAGLYRVTAALEFPAGTLPVGGANMSLNLTVEGGTATVIHDLSTTETYARIMGTVTTRCTKGQKLSLNFHHDAPPTWNTSGSADYNFVTFERIGGLP
ncbi:MAG: hypothetical protein U0414_26500 [Polyangiaceae bacterium]